MASERDQTDFQLLILLLMKVIILSLVKLKVKLDTPKSLIKIDDRRMFQIQLEQLELAGVKKKLFCN